MPVTTTWGFSRAVVINLQGRTERWQATSAECARLSLNYSRFEAVMPADPGGFKTAGARGCTESHHSVIATAFRENLESILILEDDVAFASSTLQIMPSLQKVLSWLEWDVLYLYVSKSARRSGAMKAERHPLAEGAHLVRIDWSLATHAYAIHRRAMPVILHALRRNKRLVVDQLLARRALPHLKVYGLVPDFATQRGNLSDVSGMDTRRIES